MHDNANQPAFPTHTKPGLTKREWLIGMIASGMAASETEDSYYKTNEQFACIATERANAIIEALEAPEEVHIDV